MPAAESDSMPRNLLRNRSYNLSHMPERPWFRFLSLFIHIPQLHARCRFGRSSAAQLQLGRSTLAACHRDTTHYNPASVDRAAFPESHDPDDLTR